MRSSGDRVVRCVSVRRGRQGRSHSRNRITFEWEGTPLSCRGQMNMPCTLCNVAFALLQRKLLAEILD